ncbi:MAG: response regulator transcription factor [Bacteroidales bacterium]|nr:response regulator transcription factor [Bacteroidales bacterium]
MTTIIIVDDHDIFRNSLKSMLSLDNIANVIDEAENGKEFLEKLEISNPDLVLMDIEMPIMDGIEATKKALKKYPELNILVLSMFGEEQYYVELIEAGAKGFILKNAKKKELENAIMEVSQGNSYFSNDLLRGIIARIGNYDVSPVIRHKNIRFTKREVEILQLMCQGLSTSEIANKIFLSPNTVENYRVKLLAKTECKNAVSLVVYAIKNKIIEI